LSSENRVTRIVARLALTSRDDQKWHTSPTARTTVPLPHLTAYEASRLASAKRSEEAERLLYNNARGQIDEKVSYALTYMPAWPLTR
jgi:hypothetical protein